MIEINNKAGFRVDLKEVEDVVKKFLDYYKLKNYKISIALIDDEEIREINKNYRNLDMATDVLSFPSSEKEKKEDKFLGEVLINYSQTERQASHFSHTAWEEFIFILIHGLLHLLGYDDLSKEDKEEMISLGESFIKKMLIGKK
ncbi:rRNA maturation RNase YbeY [bacterium]|nr:rRNA maturation RNase YbeY [bacterium]